MTNFNTTRCIPLAVFAIAFASMVLIQPSGAPGQVTPETPLRVFKRVPDWHGYDHLAQIIEACPPWKATMSEDDWKAYLRTAIAFQKLDDEDVHTAIIVFMLSHKNDQLKAMLDASSKPMLLLRVMFELPEDQERQKDAPIYIAGGLPMKLSGPNTVQSFSVPVSWMGGKPQLNAIPVEVGGHRGMWYQPQHEFGFFRAFYKYRSNLESVLGERVTSYVELLDRVRQNHENGLSSDR